MRRLVNRSRSGSASLATITRAALGVFAVLGSLVVLSVDAYAAQPNASTPVNCTVPANSTNQCPSPPNQPGGLDIYLCYQVTSDQFNPPLVDLTDQFGVHNLVQPLSASSTHAWDNQLCNPTTETLGGGFDSGGGTVYGVSNSAAHLYCFTDNTGASPMVTVSVQNQFGTGVYRVSHSTRLCLPSWKYDPNQSPGNPPASGSTNPRQLDGPIGAQSQPFPVLQSGKVGTVGPVQWSLPLCEASGPVRFLRRIGRTCARAVRTSRQASRERERDSSRRTLAHQQRRSGRSASLVLRRLRWSPSECRGGQPVLGHRVLGCSEPRAGACAVRRPTLPSVVQDRHPPFGCS